MTNKLQKGFTLIELLVVIAIVGILAAVVLVAINPAERIKEANDTSAKSNVGQVATALEACYTQSAGTAGVYDACNTMTKLTDAKYLKTAMDGVAIAPGTGTNITNLVAYGTLKATSARAKFSTTCSTDPYVAFYTSSGQTVLKCGTAPAAGDTVPASPITATAVWAEAK